MPQPQSSAKTTTMQSKSKDKENAFTQNRAAALAELHAQRDCPLGFPASFGRIESGQTVAQYYREKHRPGGVGKGTYYPLHETMKAWER